MEIIRKNFKNLNVCYLYAEVNYGLYENVIDAIQIQTMK